MSSQASRASRSSRWVGECVNQVVCGSDGTTTRATMTKGRTRCHHGSSFDEGVTTEGEGGQTPRGRYIGRCAGVWVSAGCLCLAALASYKTPSELLSAQPPSSARPASPPQPVHRHHHHPNVDDNDDDDNNYERQVHANELQTTRRYHDSLSLGLAHHPHPLALADHLAPPPLLVLDLDCQSPLGRPDAHCSSNSSLHAQPDVYRVHHCSVAFTQCATCSCRRLYVEFSLVPPRPSLSPARLFFSYF